MLRCRSSGPIHRYTGHGGVASPRHFPFAIEILGREMGEHAERAFKYRQKAEELRAMIPDMTDYQSRETLAKIAAGYDQLAKVQDTLAAVDRVSGNR